MCGIKEDILISRLQDQVDKLQEENIRLLRDWSESQNIFVKSVKKLERAVSERDLIIKDLLSSSHKEVTQ